MNNNGNNNNGPPPILRAESPRRPATPPPTSGSGFFFLAPNGQASLTWGRDRVLQISEWGTTLETFATPDRMRNRGRIVVRYTIERVVPGQAQWRVLAMAEILLTPPPAPPGREVGNRPPHGPRFYRR